MTQPLVILGTGGNAYDVLDIVEAINRVMPTWHVAGFLDDVRPRDSSHLGLPILGGLSDARRLGAGHLFINVIGSDSSFRNRPEILASTGVDVQRFATLIHPAASVSSRARLGRGVFVGHGANVAGGVEIRDHVCVSPGVIIGHDSIVDDHALIAPGAIVSGFCRIGRAAYVGAGSAIRQRVKLGSGSLVGVGAVVLCDVEPGDVVVGNPARVLRRATRHGSDVSAAEGRGVALS